ncbi:rust resistance kinase Lr10 [Elaeis guineensis]|uniref:Rust resistance kinase Lr10 n=1 Tax=Elaeis guineensis var. tenera TaxID=51953 RepID=A0A6I9SFY1_ELAGV|nr:rust resistance kinase Lr10 [Elaeis guineensis]
MVRLGALCTILFFIFLDIGASKDDCPSSRCSLDGPEIRFPFRRSKDPEHYGYPGFELACRGNNTVIKLPSSGEFPVAFIDYAGQMLGLVSKFCPASIVLNLNVSNSPFSFFNYGMEYKPRNYTFLNCSTANSIRTTDSRYHFTVYYYEIYCLRESDDYIFAVPSSFTLIEIPKSCMSMKTIQVIWPYISYLNNYTSKYDEYVPTLKWESPDCADCETGGGTCRPDNSSSHDIMCSYQPQCNLLPDHHGGGCKKRWIIGASLGIFVLLVTTAATIKVGHSWLLKRKKEKENQLQVEKFLEDYKALKPLRYSYADIKKMTNQFKTKLGEGGYGSVFKGFLPNGVPIAVKILVRSMGSNGEDFVNEVGTIGRIHHVNVVRLLGFCADGFKRALIYEFMSNESLAKFIFSVDGRSTLLGWDKLHNIAIGIARGIEYLHQGCDQRILHFDIKPHNILLDHNFCPKISDFGLAKLCSKEQSIVSMTAARGTAGYIAPEVCSRNFGNVSYKSDVYSFGMLLLETVGGRKNMDATVENTSQVYFPEWIYNRLSQKELGLHIIEERDAIIARKLAIVALWCIQWYPVDRPSMESVVQMLGGSMENLVMPPNPFTSAGPPSADHVAFSDRRVNTNLTTIPEIYSEQGVDAC